MSCAFQDRALPKGRDHVYLVQHCGPSTWMWPCTIGKNDYVDSVPMAGSVPELIMFCRRQQMCQGKGKENNLPASSVESLDPEKDVFSSS